MLSDARKRANAAYKKRAVRRVALEMQHADYDSLKAAADAAGESVNGFIKKACAERIQKESTMIEIEHYLDEKDPVVIATITADETDMADGYRVRLRPVYSN